MRLGCITKEQLPAFENLMIPSVAEALEEDTPLIALGATENGQACGAIAAMVDEDSNLEILSLCVAPEYRRKGIAACLVDAVLKQVRKVLKHGTAEVEFAMLDAEQETLPPFLEAMGFQQELDGGQNIYFTTLGQAMNSPLFAGKCTGTEKDILPFSKIQESVLQSATHHAQQEQAPLYGPLTDPEVEKQVSCARLQGEIITAFLVFDHTIGDRLTLSCAWNGTKDPTVLPAMLRYALYCAQKHYPPETPMAVQAVTDTSARLIQRILPEARPAVYTYTRFLSERYAKGGL